MRAILAIGRPEFDFQHRSSLRNPSLPPPSFPYDQTCLHSLSLLCVLNRIGIFSVLAGQSAPAEVSQLHTVEYSDIDSDNKRTSSS
jgi:hypothetical protein